MVAARRFLLECGSLAQAVGVQVHLYGSLALTGVGHATDKAVILGLMDETPHGVDPDAVEDRLAAVALDGCLVLLGEKQVPFAYRTGLVWHKQSTLPEHPNGMKFVLRLADGSVVERIYYSVGGGFVAAAGESGNRAPDAAPAALPFLFDTMGELLARAARAAWPPKACRRAA